MDAHVEVAADPASEETGGQQDEEEKNRKAAIRQLVENNGIRPEDAQHPENITNIDLVLDDFNNMEALRYFPNLRSICLIQQAICNIAGLDCCSNLEHLTLNENQITKLEGVNKCKRLKRLYICTNALEEIGDGLQGLSFLEVLWVAENHLVSLHGLSAVPALTDLNAARNRITSAAQYLDSNLRLRSVNLADNRIWSYKEVLQFARLPCMSELSFDDPDWGENPISSLSNYQIYTLYHLPSLHVHDRMRLSEDDHKAAQAAFAKKRLFYNMRVKLVKRQAADGLRMAKALDEKKVSTLTREVETAARIMKHEESEFEALQGNPKDVQVSSIEAPDRRAQEAADRRLRDLREELRDATVAWEALVQQVHEARDFEVQRLLLELHTMGNVRLEVGSLGRDPWARSMEELVRSRFKAEEFIQHGIIDVKVQQVVRIHNRSLRGRCEELLDRWDMEPSQHVDYLFYIPESSCAAESLRAAAQEGLETQQLGEPGYQGDNPCDADRSFSPILLTNSVHLAEAARLVHHATTDLGSVTSRAIHRAAFKGTPSMRQGSTASSGTLLVCSAYLLDQQPDDPSTFEIAVEDIRAWWQKHPSRASLPATGSGVASGKRLTHFRAAADDHTRKVWEVSYPELIVPEFFIDFDYVHELEIIQSRIKPRMEEYGLFGTTFRDFSFFAQLGAVEKPEETAEEAPKPAVVPTIEVFEKRHLALPDVGILPSADPTMLANLVVLNLHGRGVRRFEPSALAELPKLQVLMLSFNGIESFSWLHVWPTITYLDVSFNLIEKINKLDGLPALKRLDMSWNKLSSLDVLGVLARDAPNLEELALAGNPVARLSSYRSQVISQLCCLKLLDDEVLSGEALAEGQKADKQQIVLNEDLLMERSFISSKIDSGLASLSDLTSDSRRVSALLSRPLSPGERLTGAITDLKSGVTITRSNWRSLADIVDLRCLGLANLKDLSGFTSLRRLNVGENQFASLEELSSFVSLEELSVEENALSSLKGAAALSNLRLLDAGNNRISDLVEIPRLTKLTQLSLENNYIDSLDAFASLRCLMELYLSNNLIEELRSVLMLKHLPKLAILDLLGNDLCDAADYRRYTIFHLRKLKVLDGVGVTQAELGEADDEFSGKLTTEFLEEKLGPSPGCYTFRQLDLSGQNLRDLGQLINDDFFPSLRELNLEGNPFSSIKLVGPLSKLLVLRMSKTNIDLAKGMLPDSGTSGGILAMSHLQVMYMCSSNVSDLSHFENFQLTSLRILHLAGNDITKVEGLHHMEQLRELVLDRNKIKQFDERSFEGLRSLRELHVEDNGLKTLSNLGPLPKLRALYLSLNRVAEFTEIEKLCYLRGLLLVHLSQNPVARKPLYRAHVIHAVPTVRAIDGKEVGDEERERADQLLQVSDPTKGAAAGVYMMNEQQLGGAVYGGSQPLSHYANPAVESSSKPSTSVVTVLDVQRQRGAESQGPSPITSQQLQQQIQAKSAPQHHPQHHPHQPGLHMMGQALNEGQAPMPDGQNVRKTHASRSPSMPRQQGQPHRPPMPHGVGR